MVGFQLLPMAHYQAEVFWARGEQSFIDNRYSRKHVVRFDGGVEVPASSSPQVVPLPFSDPEAVDPEELFVAALANCHMLWFLSIAAKYKFRVDSYRDVAEGVMAKDAHGKHAMTVVTLKPEVKFSGDKLPTREELERMHQQAHDECYIANSVKTDVRCAPKWVGG